jgi:CYTH domain-containing protein
MTQEIERKFKVHEGWQQAIAGQPAQTFEQVYFRYQGRKKHPERPFFHDAEKPLDEVLEKGSQQVSLTLMGDKASLSFYRSDDEGSVVTFPIPVDQAREMATKMNFTFFRGGGKAKTINSHEVLLLEPDDKEQVRLRGVISPVTGRVMQGFITLKRDTEIEGVKEEFEFPISSTQLHDFEVAMRCFENKVVSKTRYTLPANDKTGEEARYWEIDEYHLPKGHPKAGLITAEIQLQRLDERFQAPAWLGEEYKGQERKEVSNRKLAELRHRLPRPGVDAVAFDSGMARLQAGYQQCQETVGRAA